MYRYSDNDAFVELYIIILCSKKEVYDMTEDMHHGPPVVVVVETAVNYDIHGNEIQFTRTVGELQEHNAWVANSLYYLEIRRPLHEFIDMDEFVAYTLGMGRLVRDNNVVSPAEEFGYRHIRKSLMYNIISSFCLVLLYTGIMVMFW